MAGLFLRRRLPLLCRVFRPDHEPRFGAVAGAGQRHRGFHDDSGGLLRILVEAAGSAGETRG